MHKVTIEDDGQQFQSQSSSVGHKLATLLSSDSETSDEGAGSSDVKMSGDMLSAALDNGQGNSEIGRADQPVEFSNPKIVTTENGFVFKRKRKQVTCPVHKKILEAIYRCTLCGYCMEYSFIEEHSKLEHCLCSWKDHPVPELETDAQPLIFDENDI